MARVTGDEGDGGGGSGVEGIGAPVVPEDEGDDHGAQRDVADLMARSTTSW